MTTNTIPQTVLFPDLFDKPLVATFDRRHASSDGGAVLLKAAERVYGLVAGFARCLVDRREPGPGFLRSEHVLDHFGVTEANWRDAIDKDPYFAESETPCYVGRAVAALAADPHVAQKSGRLFSSWALAKEYGFTDVDGRRPDWGSFYLRKVREILDQEKPPDDLDRFVVRSRLYQAKLDPSAAEEAARLRVWLARHE